MRGLAVLLSLGLMACSSPAVQTTEKNSIVSLSLCADSYLHALPDLEPRLAALSWQSRSALSVTPNHLKALPQADTDPERLLRWKNATRVSSAGGPGDIDLDWGEDFNAVWKNLGMLAKSLGARDPSDVLKTKLNAVPKPPLRPRILYLDRSGATAGPGTFVDAVINAAGGQNIVLNPGWQSPDTEALVQFNPDIIVTSFMGSDYAGVNDRTLRHAALSKKIESLPQVHIPGELWPCAGPGLVTAAEMLSKSMSEL